MRSTISRSAKQDSLLQSLSCRLAVAEQGVDSARAEAVEAFKDSQAFADAVAECSIDSYQLGFVDCKEATAKLFPDLDLSKVKPSGSDEEGEEESKEWKKQHTQETTPRAMSPNRPSALLLR